jgi:hypothetical protein
MSIPGQAVARVPMSRLGTLGWARNSRKGSSTSVVRGAAGFLKDQIFVSDAIVTFNRRHFVAVTKQFGLDVLLPGDAIKRREKRS